MSKTTIRRYQVDVKHQDEESLLALVRMSERVMAEWMAIAIRCEDELLRRKNLFGRKASGLYGYGKTRSRNGISTIKAVQYANANVKKMQKKS